MNTVEKIELRPCPFCGKEPKLGEHLGVWCNNDECAIVGQVFSGGPKHWNRRASSVAQAEPVTWMILHHGCRVGCTESVHATALERAIQERAEAVVALYTHPPAEPESVVVPELTEVALTAMVDRFLSWPLPASVCADPCASMSGYPHRRVGTNLLTAIEAREMLKFVLADLPAEPGMVPVSEEVPAAPKVCPITGREFFMNIGHPEIGDVATYGGPFDSYTIPSPDEDGDLRCERYDHDRGEWIEGGERLGVWLTTEQPDRDDIPDFELAASKESQ